MASKILIENYKKGIVSDNYKVFYCKESDEYFVRKIVEAKPKQKPITKSEKSKIIEYFIQNQSSPEGYNVYYCSDISDYKIVKQNKSTPISEVVDGGSVIEDKKGRSAGFGDKII